MDIWCIGSERRTEEFEEKLVTSFHHEIEVLVRRGR
jgi:hypothetical protein